jgi:hypothetical protein
VEKEEHWSSNKEKRRGRIWENMKNQWRTRSTRAVIRKKKEQDMGK